MCTALPPTFIWVWRFELSFLCVAHTSPAKRFPQPLIWFWSLLKALLFQEAFADCSPQWLLVSVFSVTALFLLCSCRGLTLYRPSVSCETMHGFWAGPGSASALWQHIMLEVWFRVAPLWLGCSLMQSWWSQQVCHSDQVQNEGRTSCCVSYSVHLLTPNKIGLIVICVHFMEGKPRLRMEK